MGFLVTLLLRSLMRFLLICLLRFVVRFLVRLLGEIAYEFFDEISKSEDIKHILTAHHINDSLETFLINISRGSGLDGLVGIPSINKKIKRPLIDFEKKDIMEYVRR